MLSHPSAPSGVRTWKGLGNRRSTTVLTLLLLLSPVPSLTAPGGVQLASLWADDPFATWLGGGNKFIRAARWVTGRTATENRASNIPNLASTGYIEVVNKTTIEFDPAKRDAVA